MQAAPVEVGIAVANWNREDEAHCHADGDLPGRRVFKGRPALVDSTCPRWGEKASHCSAVCVETGETE